MLFFSLVPSPTSCWSCSIPGDYLSYTVMARLINPRYPTNVIFKSVPPRFHMEINVTALNQFVSESGRLCGAIRHSIIDYYYYVKLFRDLRKLYCFILIPLSLFHNMDRHNLLVNRIRPCNIRTMPSMATYAVDSPENGRYSENYNPYMFHSKLQSLYVLKRCLA